MRRLIPVLMLCCLMGSFTFLFSQDNKLAEFKRFYPEELESSGFELKTEQKLQIKASGYYESKRHRDVSIGNAWILNAVNRDVVWELRPEESDNDRYFELTKEITLPAGKYEVYYSSYPTFFYEGEWDDGHREWHNYRWHGFGDLFRRIGRSRDYDWRRYDDVFDDLYFSLSGNGQKLNRDNLEKLQDAARSKALISFDVRRDERRELQGFSVNKPMEVDIYAVGEARYDGNFDYGVILKTDTWERLWELTYDKSEHAGGSGKNRVSNTTVTLPAGEYLAIYVSDDSHSPIEWNAAPPYDPAFWGMTITPKNNSDRNKITLNDAPGFELKNAIVDFTRLEDDEFRSHGFSLKKSMKLRVLATGEGSDGDMYDYGWIVDAKSRKKVWEMDYDATEPAGGGSKNRMIDEIIELEKGDYLAYFVTDDSHSYRDWNTSPPILEELWGMAVLPGDKNFNASDVAAYNPMKDKNVLAQIARVRDYDQERIRFKLEKDSKIRVYALGEGRRGGMFDYGWIEDAKTGDLIWEMSYRKTDHAGGARKNRMVDDFVELKAGEYILFYETDDSHSFEDWNAAPPHDPESWGITVFLAENN